jgi:hypothetical protein
MRSSELNWIESNRMNEYVHTKKNGRVHRLVSDRHSGADGISASSGLVDQRAATPNMGVDSIG